MNTYVISKQESRLNQMQTEIAEGGINLHTPILSRVAKRDYNGTRVGKCNRAWWAGADMFSVVREANLKARRGY